MLKTIGVNLSAVAILSIVFLCGNPLYADIISTKSVSNKQSLKDKISPNISGAAQTDHSYFTESPHRLQIAGQDVQDIGPHEATQGLMFVLIGAVLVGVVFFAFAH